MESLQYAMHGIRFALVHEPNLRLQVIGGAAAIVLGLWLGLSQVQMAIVILTAGVVIGFEMLNSALETLIDLIHPEYHTVIRHAKDAAAGAVLAASVGALLIGLLLLGPPLIALF